MHAVALAILAVAGCGRFGFDAQSGDAPSGPAPALCDPVELGQVTLDGAPRSLRAVPGGGTDMAVLIGTTANNIYAVRVTARNAVESVHLPLTGAYVLQGAGEVGGNIFVYADYPPTEAYLKRLDPTWDTYGTMDYGELGAIDPPVAATAGNTKAIQAMKRAGELSLREIDPIGNELAFLGSRTGVGASLTARDAGARIAIDAGDGTCIVKDSPPATDLTITGCSAPRFPAQANGSLLLHRKAGSTAIVVRELVNGEAVATLDGDRDARAGTVAGALWIASVRDTQPLLARVGQDGGFSESAAPFTAPFDFGPAGLVWLDGTTLHAAQPCAP